MKTVRIIKSTLLTVIGMVLISTSGISQDNTERNFGHKPVNRNASAPHIDTYFKKKLNNGKTIGLKYEGTIYTFDLFEIDRRTGMMDGEMIENNSPQYYDVLIECAHAIQLEGNFIQMSVKDMTVNERIGGTYKYREINCKRKLRTRRAAIIVSSAVTGVAAYIGALVGLSYGAYYW